MHCNQLKVDDAIRRFNGMRTARWATAVALAVGVSCPTGASAGSYAVGQCDYELGITTNAFQWQAAGAPAIVQQTNSGCGELGLGARSGGVGSAQTYPNGVYGRYAVRSPEGTRFTQFSGSFGTLSTCCISGMEARAHVYETSDGSGDQSEIFHGSLGPSTWQIPAGLNGPVRLSWDGVAAGFEAEQITYGVSCTASIGCSQSTTGDLRVRARSFEFTLNDHLAPTFNELDGQLFANGWIRGAKALAFDARDVGGGIANVSAALEGGTSVGASADCAIVDGRYSELKPCPLQHEGLLLVDTTEVPDGSRSVIVRATDASGASAEVEQAIKVDNTDPPVPEPVVVEAGDGWRSVQEFSVGWADPADEHAPVVKAHYELCDTEIAYVCSIGEETGTVDNSIEVTVPARGVYKLRLWLEDAAGNVNSMAKSEVKTLRFDDSIPGQARLEQPVGWLGAAQAQTLVPPLGLLEGTIHPISGVAGYSVTTDGTEPDSSVDAGTNYPIAQLPEGTSTIRVRAVSGAGIPSDAVGSTAVQIDRSSPDVFSGGVPDAGTWQRDIVAAYLWSRDQADLSGIAAASADRPVEDGGYIAYRVGDGPLRRQRGGEAPVLVGEDGHHVLTYEAFDVAGNSSGEKSVSFKIDRIGPSGGFEGQDGADPQKLRVEVSDATSGVAEGRIEYRREGQDAFKGLATALEDGRLTARLDDAALSPGRYTVRAVVTDVAGNRTMIDRRLDGSAMTLGLPLRRTATVAVDAAPKVERCAKAKRGAKRKPRAKRAARKRAAKRRCPKRSAKRPAGGSLALPHGKALNSAGRIATGQGEPLAGVDVTVEGQPRSGGPFVRLGVARTDAQGAFRFAIPAGPSRTVRYSYAGSNTVRPSTAQLVAKVKAAARLSVSRRRLRNGQVVRFSGRLLGRPIPPGGKLVALQARVGRSWRTFATPRASAKGVFRHRYRFTSTTGLRRYAFRAVIAREAAYPYEAGVSRTVKVTVRGR